MMTGTYTEITIGAPVSADVGAEVEISVEIKTIVDLTIYVIPVLSVNGEVEATGSYETITKGNTHSWLFSLTMPNNSIVVGIASWLETYQVDWHTDYSVEHSILLGASTDNGGLPPDNGGGNGEVPPTTTLDINTLIQPLISIMIVMMMMKMMTGMMSSVSS